MDLTAEQQEALAAVRETLAEMPAEPSPAMARSWIAHLRGVLQQVDNAWREEGGQR